MTSRLRNFYVQISHLSGQILRLSDQVANRPTGGFHQSLNSSFSLRGTISKESGSHSKATLPQQWYLYTY
jgi:hypothetical protein